METAPMSQKTAYRFHIDAYTPETIPMARLADYMAELARLLGQAESVHFERVEPGSTVLVQTIDAPATPKVQERLTSVVQGEGAKDARKAFAKIDDLLAADNAVGTLSGGAESNVIRFPGRERPKPLDYGTIRQHTSVDGILVKIGGRDRTAHATLEDGNRNWNCEMTRAMARELASYLYSTPLRFHGDGKWRRNADGVWHLEHFRVSHYDVLDDTGWFDTIAKLRAVEGADWRRLDDPLAALAELRGQEDDSG